MTTPAIRKATSDLSLMIFNSSNGGQPIGDVFLIINDTLNAAVNTAVFRSNLFFTWRKQ